MTPQIPTYLIVSAIIMSVGFLIHVWYMVHRVTDLITSLKVAAALVGWFLAVYILGINNFFSWHGLIAPNIVFTFILLFIILKKLYSWPPLQEIADKISPPWIITVHIWRIGGIGFITLYTLGVLPAQFAYPSGIGDLTVGLAGLVVAYLYTLKKSFSRKLAIIWNYVGMADLISAVSLGILAYPVPLQVLPTKISTGAITQFPLVLVPCFAVPLAIFLHFLSLRVLKRRVPQ